MAWREVVVMVGPNPEARGPEEGPVTGVPWARCEPRRWRAAVAGAASPEETASFDAELADRLPSGLAAALPEVPVVTLFVTVSLARVGRRGRDLRAVFGLSPAQARTIVRYATSRVRLLHAAPSGGLSSHRFG